MKTTRTRNVIAAAIGLAMGLALTLSTACVWAQDDDIANEYRLTLFPYHRINDKWTTWGYVGYVWNTDADYHTYYLGPGATYTVNRGLEIQGGLIGTYTDNENSSDKLELRPFVGAKLYVPNTKKLNVYNWTRYEYRLIRDSDTDNWDEVPRLRSRFGVEFPLAPLERAWQPKTYYGLADAEVFYRFDRTQWNPFRLRAGIGYVLNPGMRIELIYHAQYTRPSGSTGLEHTENIWRLNVKFGVNKGLFGPQRSPDVDD